jgi:hypothetical protein
MKIRTNRTAIIAATAVAVVAAIAGIANAAIPSPNGTLVGCYAKKSGALRLTQPTKKCGKHEKRTSWNTKGVAGAPGAQGVQGPKGDQGLKGDVGPSNGYHDDVSVQTPLPDAPGSMLTLSALPAGSYVATFTADYKDGAGGGVLDCTLAGGSMHFNSKVEVEAGRRTAVAITGAVTLDAAGDIEVLCDDNSGDESLVNASITAIHVGTLADA